MLRQSKLETRIEQRAQRCEWAVRALAEVVKSDGQVGAGLEALRVGEIISLSVLRQHWNTNEHAAGQLIEVVPLHRATEDGIETRDLRTETQRRSDQPAKSSARAARACSGAAGTGSGLPAESANTTARRILHYARKHAQNGCARLGPQDIGIGDVQVVARNPDVQIIFQGERDRIIDREHEFAILHELLNTRR